MDTSNALIGLKTFRSKSSKIHSVTFGIYTFENVQVGYCRVITDQSSFAYLADVFVLEEHHGLGLSKFLMECIMGIPEFKNLRTWLLATKDAHGLYRQFGFDSPKFPEKIMQISRPDLYKSMGKYLELHCLSFSNLLLWNFHTTFK